MKFLDDVYAKRQTLAAVLADREYYGIRQLVEQLYPDRAHFIYELLQNAEDANATEANFRLRSDCLTFEHNGRPFSEDDVWRITNIGKSDKAEKSDQIGRFGVGFKAVFAYCETPSIWSSSVAFKITDLVLPTPLEERTSELGLRTQFQFPFNNPKKPASAAYAEIEQGLNELAETTLLFLSNLAAIRWQTGGERASEVRRIHHSEHHVEIVKTSGRSRSSAHFLKFDQPVQSLQTQRVAIAFALDFLPGITQFHSAEPLVKQLKIVPAEPGRVAVFFPAEKETSGLRFHVHAPFVPEVSRASIKESAANEPLFQQLAVLTAHSLHCIRDLGLLNVEFLGVLPNLQDEQIPPRYQCIRTAIVDEMNAVELTPTHGRSHAPAQQLLQAKASLKELLAVKDLTLLASDQATQPNWCVGVTQRNSNADRFLAGLQIRQWDVEEFVEALIENASEGNHRRQGRWVSGPDSEFMIWLSGKSPDWHQRLYALLFAELSGYGGCRRVADTRIVRLSDGSYSTGAKSFFPTDEVREDELLPRVDVRVYSSGKSKTQQDSAQKFLREIGVREVGEAEQIESILKQRYTSQLFRPHKQDLRRFIMLVEKDSSKASLFRGSFVFECADGKWRSPVGIFLDSPFLDTGLTTYYEALGDDATRFPLAGTYTDFGISVKRIVAFAQAVGVQTQLLPTRAKCRSNPDYRYLRSVAGERYTSPIDQDWIISDLETLLEKKTVDMARLFWRTMTSLPSFPDYLTATYQKSQAGGSRHAPSQLVHELRQAAWVPQGNDLFVRPEDAVANLLPSGFAYDPGARWLQTIEFGKVALQKSEGQRQKEIAARDLGFKDQASLERARRFAALPTEDQERILSDSQRSQSPELPDYQPSNPERRAERVGLRAAAAPERRTEERARSVSVGRDEVKEEAAQYLRQQYTNADGEMVCQICKFRLPFRLDDGRDYFETVEFLPTLTRRHHQNYLALCPNHSAMFQYVNGSTQRLPDAFGELVTNELAVLLAQTDMTIYFTKLHIADLQAVIRVEQAERAVASARNPVALGQQQGLATKFADDACKPVIK
jgi:hypothetical protein